MRRPWLPWRAAKRRQARCPLVKVVWSKLSPVLAREPRFREGVDEVVSAPGDPDALALFRIRLKKLLEKNNGALAKALDELVGQRLGGFPEDRAVGWRDVLGKDDKVLERLEMIYLLRSGIPPEEVARNCTWTWATCSW